MYTTQQAFVASYVLVKKDGKYAFLLRSNTKWMNGYYSLPAGKVEVGESYSAAAIREAKEEVGITIMPENLKHAATGHRDEPSDNGRFWVDVFFEVTDYEGEAHNAEPDVHGELKWFALSELPDNIIPSLRPVLEAFARGERFVEHGFTDSE